MLDLFRDSKGKVALDPAHFPTRMQAVVWRNWGLVSIERLAEVLECTAEQVIELAQGMGMNPSPKVNPDWLSRGYITLIRANWHLLTYEQLLTLLGWTGDQLAFALKEDDFLWVKLGHLKPETTPNLYRALTAEEQELTAQLRQRIQQQFPVGSYPVSDEPFGFLHRFNQAGKEEGEEAFSEERSYTADEQAADETWLTSEWTVAYPQQTKSVKHFVDRFIQKIDRLTRVKLTELPTVFDTKTSQQSKMIELSIEPDESLLAESHTVTIEAESIHIQAVDEPGLLRGLQWIAKQIEQAHAPKLKLGKAVRRTKLDLRYTYSYFGVFGDPLVDPELDPYPDDLLEALSDIGVNGVWLHIVLYNLIPWDEAPHLSVNWEKRLEGLRNLTERAAKYGIGIYLYFNEPRAMPIPFYEKHPDWRGPSDDGIHAALCTSRPEIQEYLTNSTAKLFTEVPSLAGLFTITMSENLTHCYSRGAPTEETCPRCSKRKANEIAAEVNRCIAKGAFSAKPDARIVCWTWGWSRFTEEELIEGINLLPDGVRVMSVSEELMPTNIANTPGHVIDYSISIIGPGHRSKVGWEAAKKRGLQTMAKVQFNNSWECSAVPYLPVFDLVEQHLHNLSQSGVTGLQLSWTLGGYPSPTLELASEYYWETEMTRGGKIEQLPRGKDQLIARKYGQDAAGVISKAISQMSHAFQEFPFHISTIYTAPQNYGPMNLLYLEPSGYNATMVGLPYDDLRAWRSIYTNEVFESQFHKLTEKWIVGLEMLRSIAGSIAPAEQPAYTELVHVAEGAYYHFRSTALQISFVMTRDRYLETTEVNEKEEARQKLLKIVDEELELAKALYGLARRDSRIGFEATNHYYYTHQALQEKVLNCLHIQNQLQA